MEIQVFSDIHLEFKQNFPRIVPTCDYLFLAGDIGYIDVKIWSLFLKYCSKNWKYVFYVLGNHEYYGPTPMVDVIQQYKTCIGKKYTNVHLLNNESYQIPDGPLVYGFVGWTKSPFLTSYEAQCTINDYNNMYIKKGIPITPESITNIANHDIRELINFLQNIQVGTNLIIMSHFPPSSSVSAHPLYNKENSVELTSYFSWENLVNNELKDVICRANVRCWIFGHTHWGVDCEESGIRYISNQLGYGGKEKTNGRLDIKYMV